MVRRGQGGCLHSCSVAPPDDVTSQRRVALRSAVLAMVGLAIATVILALAQGGPAYFLQLGERSPGLPQARAVLGANVPTPLADGHDGDFFWQLARDPLLRDEAALDEHLDRPVYRAQRIGYPALAAPWRLAGEGALLWGLVITNIAAIGAGSYALGCWSALRGGPGRLAFAFAFNPLALYALLFDLGDAVALAGLVVALYQYERRREAPMVMAACIAVLAKEPTLAALVAVAILVPGRSMRSRALLVMPAVAAAGAWRLYVLSRDFGPDPAIGEFSGVPFRGFVDAWRLVWWPDSLVGHAAISLALLGVALGTVAAWIARRDRIELVAALPFAALTPFLSVFVVSLWYNAVRATGAALLLLTAHLVWRRPPVEPDRAAGIAPYP